MTEQLLLFTEAVKDLNFTQTAERIGVSKAYVSQQISFLEKKLNIKLLHRTTRSIQLTSEGCEIAEKAKLLVTNVNDIIDFSGAQQNSINGILTISCPISFGQVFYNDIIEGLQKLCPNLKIELQISNHQIDLANSQTDVAIRIADQIDDFFIAKKIGFMQKIICASPQYLRQYGEPKSPKDLSRHDCAYYINPLPIKYWNFCVQKEIIKVNISGNIGSNMHELLINNALQDKSIIDVPKYIVEQQLEKEQLVEILKKYRQPPIPIHAVYLPRINTPNRITVFIEYLKSYFSRTFSP
ncbi:MAG: LysR family transcriptional regulator [Ostreibacterium sp.]